MEPRAQDEQSPPGGGAARKAGGDQGQLNGV